MSKTYRHVITGVAALCLLAVMVWCFWDPETIVSGRLLEHKPAAAPARGSEEIFGGVKVRFAATHEHKTISILSLGINPRYTHLLSAAEALPRVTARARSSN